MHLHDVLGQSDRWNDKTAADDDDDDDEGDSENDGDGDGLTTTKKLQRQL